MAAKDEDVRQHHQKQKKRRRRPKFVYHRVPADYLRSPAALEGKEARLRWREPFHVAAVSLTQDEARGRH